MTQRMGECARCGGNLTADHKCPITMFPGAAITILQTTELDLNNYLRPELKKFAIDMEDEMRANDHKGKDGWKHSSETSLFAWLMDEVRELYEAMTKARTIKEKDRYEDDVISEAADTANIAMMIADLARRKKEERA